MANKLFSDSVVELVMKEDRFAVSHGARGLNLGAGALYYSIPYMARAKLCVCLGSGSGFVPKLMRQSQRDRDIGHESRTVLIDADIRVNLRAGFTDYFGQETPFTVNYPEVEVVKALTQDAVTKFEDRSIDYLHIDADHTYEGVSADFEAYLPKVKRGSIITLHDTESQSCGVRQFLNEISLNYETFNFNIGNGTALVRVP
jgi:hypothetical protein